MSPERYIGNVITDRGLKIKAVSEKTGINYQRLQTCIRGQREMRIDEYLALCAFFSLDPRGYREETVEKARP